MSGPPALIVIGVSARALAASARRAGFAPLAIDVFGDEDTFALSAETIRLEGGLASGLAPRPVVDAVASLVRRCDPIALVYGSGFEDQPDVLEAIARLVPIAGNRASVVAEAKDPDHLSALCSEFGVAHPEIAESEPASSESWLIKKRGAAGGAHVGAAKVSATQSVDQYFQRRVEGEACSALFLADGERAQIIGFSAQWAAPTPTQPFRFGGACGPVALNASAGAKAARAVASLSRRLRLVGLNSIDFLVASDEIWLLEINPRPGATLDVFDSAFAPLLGAHVSACGGRMTPVPVRPGFAAVEIVYAPLDLRMQAGFRWPYWAADRPAAGVRIARGDPFCSVRAEGPTFDVARALVKKRALEIAALAMGG
ncbi:MAG: ATP-grasp domain-containing protein [Hyphomicrobiales bacterium]|nr:ATP-grasp domain-containing protein [Hyphomicrobiales bacterium]